MNYQNLNPAKFILLLFAITLSLLSVKNSEARIVYVKPVPTGDSSGTSWANAAELSLALKNALSNDSLWVAAGTYYPVFDETFVVPVNPIAKTFFLKNGVSIFGGFAGTEINFNQRDFKTNLTILDGDNSIINDTADNCLSVVSAINQLYPANYFVNIDGFVITNGNSKSVYSAITLIGRGGGIHLRNVTKSRIANNTLFKNYAIVHGGAIYISTPDIYDTTTLTQIINNVMYSNWADRGGAFYHFGVKAKITQNIIYSNSARSGGGIFSGSGDSVTISNNYMYMNTGSVTGGAIHTAASSSVIINNLMAKNNGGVAGGGIYVEYGTNKVIGNTFYNNIAQSTGAGIYDISSPLSVINNIFWLNKLTAPTPNQIPDIGNSLTLNRLIKRNFLQGSYALSASSIGNFFGVYPDFTDTSSFEGPDGIMGTYDDGLSLKRTSYAINNGDTTITSADIGTTDVSGNNRFNDSHIDIGAYEFGCSINDSLYVPPLNIQLNNNPSCEASAAVTFSIEQNYNWKNAVYQWKKNGLSIPGANLSTYVALPGYDYLNNDTITVVVSGMMGCPYPITLFSDSVIPQVISSIHRFYVNKTATGLNNGLNWSNAFTNLDTALLYNGCVADTFEIWIAAGEYNPSADMFNNPNPANFKDKTFLISRNTKLYGGFIGNETSLNQRNIQQNSTILSGDIGIPNDSADNSCHVITISGTSANKIKATLDGLTITKGFAATAGNVVHKGNTFTRTNGPGIIQFYGDLTMNNCIVTRNHTFAGVGGGLYSNLSNTKIFNCLFTNNSAGIGGGISLVGDTSLLVNNLFIDNRASGSGALYVNFGFNVTLSSLFYKNSCIATARGGALSINGNNNIVRNNIFSMNYRGTNSLLSGSDITVTGSNTFSNNVLQLPESNYTYTTSGNSAIGTAAKGNLFAVYPDFKDTTNVLGTDSVLFTSDDGFSLKNISPCIDMGDSLSLQYALKDIAGNPRRMLNSIDMGPYEFECLTGDSIYFPTINLNTVGAYPQCDRLNMSFKSTYQYPGESPQFFWIKNGTLIQDSVKNTFTAVAGSGLANGDTLTHVMLSSRGCMISNIDTAEIIISVTPLVSRLYVDSAATGANTGLTWADAFNNLQSALEYNQCLDTTLEIWVAKGTYKPSKDHLGNGSPAQPRDKTFYIKDGYKIYGGFAGNETSIAQRNIKQNTTTLSGDIGTAIINTDNSYHVVMAVALPTSAKGITIDGFTITGGNANLSSTYSFNGTNVSRHLGAGLYIGNGINIISNNNISGNTSLSLGAGMFTVNSNNNISSNIISQNVSETEGGGGYLNGGNQVIKNNFIFNNKADAGSGLKTIGGSDTIYQNVFFSNASLTGASGTLNLQNGNHWVGNNTFFKNTYTGSQASPSAALHTTTCSTIVVNNIFCKNTIPSGSVSLVNDYKATNSTNTFKNNILQHPESYYQADPVNYGMTLASTKNLFNTNPLFKDTGNLAGIDSVYGTADDGFMLSTTSHAIDAGDTSLYFSAYSGADITNTARIKLSRIDIGAYEYSCDTSLQVAANVTIQLLAGNLPSCDSSSLIFKALTNTPANVAGFQWTRNGIDIPGRTNDTLILTTSGDVWNNDLIGCRFKSSRGCLLSDSATATPLEVKIYQSRIYVNANATGNNNGTSWADAFTNLQHALTPACTNAEVWVATGVYKPSVYPFDSLLLINRQIGNLGVRDYTFYVSSGVKLYGGFAGTETSLSQRAKSNITTLSGDIGLPNDSTDNCYHVVLIGGFSDSIGVVIDGFTIEKGRANSTSSVYFNGIAISKAYGGGIFALNSKGHVISNNIITNNNSTFFGGGMYFTKTKATLNGNIIKNNTASSQGGGVYVTQATSELLFTNNVVYQNISAGHGAGMHFESGNNRIINNTICYNTGISSGGISTGGGMNEFYNNILWGNKKGTSVFIQGSDYYRGNGTNTFKNNLLQLSSGSYSLNNSGNYAIGVAIGNLFGINPLFKDSMKLAGSDNIFRNSDDGIALTKNSLCINTGDSSHSYGLSNDITGNQRLMNLNIDMGAYEYSCNSNQATRLYVNANATGANTGLSWNDAFLSLQDALDFTCISNLEIWVAAGVYKPTHDAFGSSSPMNSRDKTFAFSSGMKIFGGFLGNEVSVTQRDVNSNITTLSGDIGILDDSTDNCYHVAIISNQQSLGVTLSGVTITDGVANGLGNIILMNNNVPRNSGSGLFIINGNNTLDSNVLCYNNSSGNGGAISCLTSSIALTGNKFMNNYSNGNGGGIYLDNSHSIFQNNSFSDNSSSINGGAIYSNAPLFMNANNVVRNKAIQNGGALYVNADSTILIGNNFDGNTGNSGGALYLSSGLNKIYNNILINSNALDNGGAIYLNGSTNALINNIISNNSAQSNGGGICSYYSNNTIISNTIYSNKGQLNGGGIYNTNGTNQFIHNIFWKNKKSNNESIKSSDFINVFGINTFRYNAMQLDSSLYTSPSYLLGNAEGNIYATDPTFVDTTNLFGNDSIYGTKDDGLRLKSNSKCIDIGDTLSPALPYDVTNRERIRFGRIDIGAYEFACDIDDDIITPSISIDFLEGGTPICDTNKVIFRAQPNYSGATHNFQWLKNNANINGETRSLYHAIANNEFNNGDSIACVITSKRGCLNADTAISPAIIMNVLPNASRLYVKHNASGLNNGTSWTDAFTDLQSALTYNQCRLINTEIWVASGTYKPSVPPSGSSNPANTREKTFLIPEGMRLFGGFNGTETQLIQRNWLQNSTVLSGDIGNVNDSTDNCYHVIISLPNGNDSSGIVIDGFIITKGQANGTLQLNQNGQAIERYRGGGLYVKNFGANTISNNVFISNHADEQGGGGYIGSYYYTRFINNTCTLNKAGEGGGIVIAHSINSGSHITSNKFINNHGFTQGGAVYVFSGTDTFTNNYVYGNSSGNAGGGILFEQGKNHLLKSNTIISNSSYNGGGIATWLNAQLSYHCNITGNTIVNNIATQDGGAINMFMGINTISNNLIAGNKAARGGGILSFRPIYAVNNTIVKNESTEGGGIYSSQTLSAKNNIFWMNTQNGNSAITGSDLKSTSFVLTNNNLQLTSTNYNLGNNDTGNIFNLFPGFLDTTNITGSDGIHRTYDDGYSITSLSPCFNTGDTTTSLVDIAGTLRHVYSRVDMGAYEFDSSTALPVRLTDFTAKRNKETDMISWTTSNEKNIISYEVQQSADATNFKNIGMVSSNNKSLGSRYRFSTPALLSSSTYYRLRINETDGAYSYSNVVIINETPDPLSLIFVYPNPSRLDVRVNSGGLTIEQLKMHDASGRTIHVKYEGDKVNLEGVQSGIYFLEVKTDQGTRFFKIVKE